MLEYTRNLETVRDRLFFHDIIYNYECCLTGAYLNISFNVTDEVNVSFVLNCISEGGPINEMLWQRDDRGLIQNSNRFPLLADGRMGLYLSTLIVYGRMSGNYICCITNEFNDTLMKKEYRIDGM